MDRAGNPVHTKAQNRRMPKTGQIPPERTQPMHHRASGASSSKRSIAALALTAWVFLTGLNIVNDEYDPRSLLKKAASPPEASIDDIIGDGDGAIAAPARAWSNWDAGVRSVC